MTVYNEKPSVHVIDFFCGVNSQSVEKLIRHINKALNEEASEIIIRISSSGGSLTSAFDTYSFLRSVPVPLTMYNYGNVDSSAIILFLAADSRIATPYSGFMLHQNLSVFKVDAACGLFALREITTSMEFDIGRYTEIFNERTKNAEKMIDVVKCLKGEPLIIGTVDARICGITTGDPTIYTSLTRTTHYCITDS